MAVALGLILAASHGLSDTETSSMRAFSKVVALLPARLRPRLESLAGATLNAPLGSATVATDSLPPIAAAIHAREQLRFSYHDASGNETHREAEPYRLVLRGRAGTSWAGISGGTTGGPSASIGCGSRCRTVAASGRAPTPRAASRTLSCVP